MATIAYVAVMEVACQTRALDALAKVVAAIEPSTFNIRNWHEAAMDTAFFDLLAGSRHAVHRVDEVVTPPASLIDIERSVAVLLRGVQLVLAYQPTHDEKTCSLLNQTAYAIAAAAGIPVIVVHADGSWDQL
jgi:hypothetical protein